MIYDRIAIRLKADEKIQRAVSDLNSQIEEVNSRGLKVL